MMDAVRAALNQAWGVSQSRPYLRGRLLDAALVALVGVLALVSLGLTVAARLLEGHVDVPGSNSWWAPVLLSVLLAFVAVMFLYATVPAADVRARDAWPASLLVAVALVALQNLFALYVANFAHYDDVYGSLGAIVAFMFFVYLAA